MVKEKKGIGCIGWIGILTYLPFTIGFFLYVFDDRNEVFGYYDILATIISLAPIFLYLNLYKKENIKDVLKYLIIVIFILCITSLLGGIKKSIYSQEISLDILFYLALGTAVSGLFLYFFYINPWIKNKKMQSKQEKDFKNLILEGKRNVSKSNKDFINKLEAIHGEKFDYSNVILEEFLGAELESKIVNIKYHNTIKLICNDHNVSFSESLDSIFTTDGCERCKIEKKHKKALTKKDNSLAKKNLIREEIINSLKEIQDDVNETKEDGKPTIKTVRRIDKNLNILAKIEDFKIRSNESNIEETISNIVNLIDDQYEFKDVKDYIESVTKWFKYWDKLESLSQNFMIQSEYLYNSIKSSEFEDYSPFVLYSCRVLEYELLQKVFIGYHNYINEKFPQKEILFSYNKESLNSKTIKDIETGIIKSFKRYIINGNPKYTLGDMRLLLNILPSKSKPKGSKRYQLLLALQELNHFIESEIGDIPSKLIKNIENVSSNYRNPSAHTGIINKEKADKFYLVYKSMMNDLLSKF